MMSENPFSMTCEKVGASEGSVNALVQNDFRIFKALFDYDFGPIEKDLGISCFSQISDYKAIHKKDLMYNKNVSEKVRALSKKLEAAKDEKEFFDGVTGFYKDFGVGMFGLNKAFRIDEKPEGGIAFRAINNMDTVMLDDLVGYEIIADIKNRNYKFIIYMDDLSFEEFEIEYKFLKAVIEGGVETKPENILIYATSNRRHLIKESWNDRNDQDNSNDRHHSDTVEEKLSLVNRFGVTINYSKPTQKEYFDIVVNLARRAGVTLDDEKLKAEANKWELSHGGISGRTAEQFVNYLASQPEAFQ